MKPFSKKHFALLVLSLLGCFQSFSNDSTIVYVGTSYSLDPSSNNHSYIYRQLGRLEIKRASGCVSKLIIDQEGDTLSLEITIEFSKGSFTKIIQGKDHYSVTTQFVVPESGDTIIESNNYLPFRQRIIERLTKDSTLYFEYFDSPNSIQTERIIIRDRKQIGRIMEYEKINDSELLFTHLILFGKENQTHLLLEDTMIKNQKPAAHEVNILDEDNHLIANYSGNDGKWYFKTNYIYRNFSKQVDSETFKIGADTAKVNSKHLLYDSTNALIQETEIDWRNNDETVKKYENDILVCQEMKHNGIIIKKIKWNREL